MPTSSHSPELLIDWDGQRLRIRAAPGRKIAIDIDGCRFIEQFADANGMLELSLPYSPSGHVQLQIRVSSRNDHDKTIESTFEIGLKIPGINPAARTSRSLSAPRNAERLLPADAKPLQREVTIIVPVYNATEDVERCLDSVLAHTTGPSRLIVIDDASTDARITPLLDRYRGNQGVDVLANPNNLGFTATVNRGIALAGNADVVLLNADAQVAANWLSGLRRALHSADDVATVTAVSDNAGAFSVPELEQENPLPAQWSFDQTALALWQDAGLAYPQLPTGNGFCMLIRREVIDRIGAFDVQAFPQGYGEENDFCQRACAAGYRHLIAGNVLVRHARSRSFGHERRVALGHAGMQILRQRWPHYEADIGATLFSFERRVLDWRVRRIYADAPTHVPRPRTLCFGFERDPTLASGYDTLMLKPSNAGWALNSPDHNALEIADLLDAPTISRWLQRHAIDLVVIHESVGDTTAGILDTQSKRLGIACLTSAETRGSSLEACVDQYAHQRSFAGSKA